MSVNRAYAEAITAIAGADGDLNVTRSELLAFSDALRKNEQLRSTLANPLLPAATRNQIVDDLLAGKVSNVTRSIIGLLVAAGRGGHISEIIDSFVSAAAAGSGKRVAVVQTALPLSADQERRLEAALAAQAGGPVELQVEIDPSVVGGIVATVGDIVIDGTVRSRINKMREAL